jgi:hypothetical protein
MLNELIQAIDNLEQEGIEEHDKKKKKKEKVQKAIIIIYQDKGIGYIMRSIRARKLIEKAKI